MEARRINKINNEKETESSYTKLCNICLEEEDEIINEMMECPPNKYINDVKTNTAERVLGVQISNREAQRKPEDQIRLLLLLDVHHITNEIEIKYHKPSIKDRHIVEQYQIPIMIYEEAQGNLCKFY